jgi:hypothetical protein
MGCVGIVMRSRALKTTPGNLGTDAADGSLELLPNDTKTQAFSKICSEDTTLLLGEMGVGSHTNKKSKELL